jgi:hypothetical protein
MNTDVTLDGLDFVVLGPRIGGEGPLALVRVTAGDLVVRDTSVTMVGTRRGSTQAFVADGRIGQNRVRASRGTRLLFERVRTRGKGLMGLGVDALDVEAVVSDALFVTGGAPACRVSSGEGASVDKAKRKLTFLSTTIVSPGTAFQLSGGGPDRPLPQTDVETVNCIVAAGPQPPPKTAMLTLRDWPTNRTARAEQGRMKSLTWNARHCMYLGWQKLIEGRPVLPIEVDNAATWQTIWRHPSDADQFQPTQWPREPLGDLALVEAGKFHVSGIGGVVVVATDRGHVGCNLDDDALPGRLRVERAIALLDRPTFPAASIADPAAVKTIEVDATKEDLGRAVNDPELPDGSLILVTGYGYRRSSPIHVKGKTLKIRFASHERGPLIISPQDTRTADGYRAFITVENGRIEIENGLFRIRSSATKIDPRWLLSVVNSEFSLRNTYLSGPALQSNRYEGLIELRRQPAAASKDLCGLIRDCTLVSKGRLIETAPGASLIVRNSLLAGFDDLASVTVAADAPPVATAFDVSQSTLTAGATFFRINSGSGGAAPHWLRFYVSECLFGPPVPSRDRPAPHPVLMRCGPEFDSRAQAVWWGTSNGYASEIDRYLDDGKLAQPDAPQEFARVWQSAWGEGHLERPLHGRGKVLLSSPLPSASDLVPASFTLQEGCEAAAWAPGDRPVGANLSVLPHPEAKRGGD